MSHASSCELLVLLDGFQCLRQRPDVVVSKAQSFDFGEFGFFICGRKHVTERLQCVVEAVHAIAFTVVGFDAANLLQLHHNLSAANLGPRFAVALLFARTVRLVLFVFLVAFQLSPALRFAFLKRWFSVEVAAERAATTAFFLLDDADAHGVAG